MGFQRRGIPCLQICCPVNVTAVCVCQHTAETTSTQSGGWAAKEAAAFVLHLCLHGGCSSTVLAAAATHTHTPINHSDVDQLMNKDTATSRVFLKREFDLKCVF